MNSRRHIPIGLVVALIAVLVLALRPAAKRHAEAVQCSNRMHSVLFVSTLMWPGEHNGFLPSDFLAMSNELANPVILICPADHTKHPAANWSSFTAENCSFEIVTPGLRKGDTNQVFLRCKIHGYTGFADDRLYDESGQLIRPQRIW